MADNLAPIEPHFDLSQDSALRPDNGLHVYPSPQSYETELAELLASFQDLQHELASHTRPTQCDSSKLGTASDDSSLAQIERLQDELAELLNLNDSNQQLRSAIDDAKNATSANSEIDLCTAPVAGATLKLYDPDEMIRHPRTDDTTETLESGLNQQMDVLHHEVAQGEEELARAQATLEALLNRSQHKMAAEIETALTLKVVTDTSDADGVNDAVIEAGKAADHFAADHEAAANEAFAEQVSEKDALIDELQVAESALQHQLNEASSQTDTLRSELDQVRESAKSQQVLHEQEIVASQQAAQHAIADAVATEKLSAAETLTKTLSDEVAQLRESQAKQATRLNEQSLQLQERLEQAIRSEAEVRTKLEAAHQSVDEERAKVSKFDSQLAEDRQRLAEATNTEAELRAQLDAAHESVEQETAKASKFDSQLAENRQRMAEATKTEAELRAKLDVAQSLADQNESQASNLNSQHAGELRKLTAALADAETSKQLLNAEAENLQRRASEMESNHQKATAATEAFQQQWNTEQERLTAIQADLEIQCERATKENEQLQTQLSELAEQKRMQEETIQKQAAKIQLDAQSAVAAEQRMRQESNQAGETTANLAKELDLLRAGHESLQQKCATQVDQIESLLDEKQELDTRQQAKSTSLNAQTAELLRISATHQNLVKQSETQAAQIISLLNDNEQHAANEVQSAQTIQQSEKRVSAMKGVQQQLTKQLGELASQLQILLQRYETVQSDNESQKSTLDQQQAEIQQLQRLYDDMHQHSLSQATQLEQLQDEKERLAEQTQQTTQSLDEKRAELDQLLARYEAESRSSQEQAELLASLQAENEQLLSDESASSQTLSDTLSDRLAEIERLTLAHETIRAQSVEQADKIMRLINENQRLTRADRMRAQELAERKAELVHLRNDLDDLKISGDTQASRIDLLINEKRQLMKQKSESESIGLSNLQAAASDYEKLKAEKQAVDDRLLEIHGAATAINPPAQPVNRTKQTRKRSKELTDDLTRIEGIGPKIQTLLAEKRIKTYRKLSGTNVDRLQQILQDAGGHFHMHDPATWPDQAQLAADGDWKKLVRLQDSLVGGRRA